MPTGKMESGCVLSILETAFPHPSEEYADAFFCQEMTAALESAAKEYKVRFLETVDEIRAGGLESAEFVLRREEKRNKSVNVPLLREELPELFAELAFVSAANASKLLSRKFIYDETRRLIKDRIMMYEEVNVKELEARLPEPEYSRYVTDKPISERYVIEVKS